MKNVKLFLTDCDGVLTDCGMYYFENGQEAKKFNTRDGMAFKLLREQGIKIGIISGEKSNIVLNRAKKLKMDYVYIGCTNKELALKEILKMENILYENVLYVGDDINDINILNKVGFSVCPYDAEEQVKKICNYISNKNGGYGVIRDIVNNYFV